MSIFEKPKDFYKKLLALIYLLKQLKEPITQMVIR